MSVGARYVAEIDRIRVDLPAEGLDVLVVISPDQATRLAALIRTALVDRERRQQPKETSNVRVHNPRRRTSSTADTGPGRSAGQGKRGTDQPDEG